MLDGQSSALKIRNFA